MEKQNATSAIQRSWILILLFLAVGCSQIPEHLKSVPLDAKDTKPLSVNQDIPNVDMEIEGTEFREYVTGKPLILIFYRGGWCPYCNTHFGEISTIQDELISMGVRIIAISPDSQESLMSTKEKHMMKYELVSDQDAKIIAAFGLAYRVTDKRVSIYKQHKMDIEKASGRNHRVLPVPAVYLVNSKGTIIYKYANPDYKVRLQPEELLKEVKALIENEM
ncbi:MAG: peroxiredoxin-like family protein [Leptospirales bacterium]